MNQQTDTRSPLDDETIEMEVLAPLSPDMSPAIAAEINQQVATAKKYPRKGIRTISDNIMSWATLNEETASECMYALERGGKPITGPSIRFAEIVRAAFGNMRVAARFVRLDLDDAKRGAVIVEAVAIDLEANQAEAIPVRRSVMTSGKGGRAPSVFSADMINMTVNAASSIARRNAILAVVPKAFWSEGYKRVVKVIQGDGTTLAKRRKDILDAFARINVTAERVFAALGVKTVEDITLEHMPALVGFMTAIKDGEPPDSVFGRAGAAEPAHATVQNPLKDDEPGPNRAAAEALKQPARQAAQQADAAAAGGDPKTGELPAETGGAATGATETETGAKTAAVEKNAPTDTAQAPATKKKPVEAKPDPVTTVVPEPEALADVTAPEQYRVYALAWMAGTSPAKAVRDRWASERGKRGELGMPEDMLIELSTAQQARIKELTAAAS